MKKIIVVIIASIVCSFMTYAQQEPTVGVDGLKLGMSVSDALYEIGKMGDYKLDNRNDSEKWLRYKDGSNSYTIYYNSQNKICWSSGHLVG